MGPRASRASGRASGRRGAGGLPSFTSPLGDPGTYLVTRSWLRERTTPATQQRELVVLRSESRVVNEFDAVVVERGDRLEIAGVHQDLVDTHTTAYAAGRRTCEPAGAEYHCGAFQAALALPRLSIGWGSGALLADGALAYVRGGGVGSHGHEPVHALWPGAPAFSGRLDDGSPFRPAAARRVGAEVRVVGALDYRSPNIGILPYVIGIGSTGVRALGRIRSPVPGPEFDQVVSVRDSAQPRAPVLARYRGAAEARLLDLLAVDL